MLWYIIICISMLYPLCIVYAGEQSGKRTQHFALAIGCCILWFYMAMRNVSVGVDTKHYAFVFQQFPDIPWSKVFTAVTYATPNQKWVFHFEPGYRLMNKIVSFFCADQQAITIVNSTLIMLLLYRLLRRESANGMLSLWLYITLGIFQTEMNVTRNAIAILIVYNSFHYIDSRQPVRYILCCLAAAMFHYASLVLIPIYWIANHYRLSLKRMVLILGLCVMVGLSFAAVSALAQNLLPYRIAKYFSAETGKPASMMVGVLNLGVFCMVYFLLGKNSRKRVLSECHMGVVMLFVNLCCFGLNIGFESAARMAGLFGPYIILLIPQMIGLFAAKRTQRSVSWIVGLVCGCLYILRMCINNIGGTMPYEFFW